MTREILFRGKRVDNGEWVYGGLCQHSGRVEILVAHSEALLDYDLYKVDPSTVGQFTGLHDKDGNKIFEGDVISRDGYYDKIVFCDGVQMLTYSANNPQRVFALTKNSIDKLDYVSGNIHDNPELLNP